MLKVPAGTQIFEEDGETLLADLTEEGQKITLARGGNGGFGNTYFTTSTNRAPYRANPGQEGIERTIWLRLKLIAEAGLVGLPNAGKSTFLATVSAAKPKIADYPFTTLKPGLGVVRVGDREFVLADIPGLIEGAHEGLGLGDRFLGHLERCNVLLHLVDATGDHAGEVYKTIRHELEAYGAGLTDKPEIVALSKVDAVDPETLKTQMARLKRAAKRAPLKLSAVAGIGVSEALGGLLQTIDQHNREGRRGRSAALASLTDVEARRRDMASRGRRTGCGRAVASGKGRAGLHRPMRRTGRAAGSTAHAGTPPRNAVTRGRAGCSGRTIP